jgi:hypothetical protein
MSKSARRSQPTRSRPKLTQAVRAVSSSAMTSSAVLGAPSAAPLPGLRKASRAVRVPLARKSLNTDTETFCSVMPAAKFTVSWRGA